MNDGDVFTPTTTVISGHTVLIDQPSAYELQRGDTCKVRIEGGVVVGTVVDFSAAKATVELDEC